MAFMKPFFPVDGVYQPFSDFERVLMGKMTKIAKISVDGVFEILEACDILMWC